ncbi:hypothetical protein CAXC1_80030 [Candidatus Xenohaliotis californiensis]|uniref:Uncharacterized protein n=1 Tax=Candidatus Xenohaliotis californiensis TaxID=84677 RepID=A0ABM9N9D8_9RICK|nr:hypothetical protein CAXC1_80030 [Candidatus Xenohaliotis californiensis]
MGMQDNDSDQLKSSTTTKSVFKTQDITKIESPTQILQTVFSESIIQELQDSHPKIFCNNQADRTQLKKLSLSCVSYIGELMHNISDIDKYNSNCPYSMHIIMQKIKEDPVDFYDKLYTRLFEIYEQNETNMLWQLIQAIVLCIDFIFLFFQALFNATNIIEEKAKKIAEKLEQQESLAICEILQETDWHFAVLNDLDSIIVKLIEKIKNQEIETVDSQPIKKQVVYIGDGDGEKYIILPLAISSEHAKKISTTDSCIKECSVLPINTNTPNNSKYVTT